LKGKIIVIDIVITKQPLTGNPFLSHLLRAKCLWLLGFRKWCYKCYY